MGTTELIREIQQLPIAKRMLVIERTLKLIRESDLRKNMKIAANSLLNDYLMDNELTSFTAIDFDNFYEAR